MSDTMLGNPDTVKDNPVTRVETNTEELKALSLDVLQLAMKIEDFLAGSNPIGTSEKAERKSPVGWFQKHNDDLSEIRGTINVLAKHLRDIKDALI